MRGKCAGPQTLEAIGTKYDCWIGYTKALMVVLLLWLVSFYIDEYW